MQQNRETLDGVYWALGRVMQVFLSWSGEASHQVARALRDWFPAVLQAVEPWLSSADVAPGAPWSAELKSRLEDAKFGIVCLTPENRDAVWLTFEAGALSNSAGVLVYALGLESGVVGGPLSQFQMTHATRDGTYRILGRLNDGLLAPLEPSVLRKVFDTWWPQLEERLARIAIPPPERARGGEADPVIERLDRILTILATLGSETGDAPLVRREPGPDSEAPIPRVFIGSSTEGLEVARQLQVCLDEVAECVVWTQGPFQPSNTYVEDLVNATAEYDFAVVVLTPDDVVVTRGERRPVPRDNLIFEVGLFTGALGRARTFLVHPRGADLRLPSDLGGVTALTYAQDRSSLQSALGPVCTRIRRVMGVYGNSI